MRRSFYLSRPSFGVQFTLRAAGVLSSCGVSAKVSPQILLRLRPRIVWADEGRGCGGLLSRSLFRGFAAKGAPLWGWIGDEAGLWILMAREIWARMRNRYWGHPFP